MPHFTGFAELRRPRDLVEKLQHDYERLAANSGDTYAAFDFFITAEHILDWLHPDRTGKASREAERGSSPLLEVTSHIANGAKHFVASGTQHNSVRGIEQQGYADGYAEPGYFEEPIVVKLSPNEATFFGTTELEAVVLAKRVLEYWQGRIPP